VESLYVPVSVSDIDLISHLFAQGVLSKLGASKELMKEIIAREEKKQAEREADKIRRAEAKSAEAKAPAAEVPAPVDAST